jgi:excisionase family DNA binding protein
MQANSCLPFPRSGDAVISLINIQLRCAGFLLASMAFLINLPVQAFEGEGMPEVLSVEEAASLMRVSPAQVRTLADAQAIPARRIGDDWRFARDALLEWLKGERFAGMAIVPPGRSENGAAVPKQVETLPKTQAANPAPTSVGERPSVASAGEIAQRDQSVLLPPGAASVDFGFSYARSEQGLYPVIRAEQNAASATATMRFGVRQDLQVTARLPTNYRRSAEYIDASVAGPVAPTRKHESYVGDASVSLLGVAATETVGRPNVIWSLDGIVPSGPGDSGVGGGVILSKSYDPTVLFAGISYMHGISTDPANSRRSLAKNNFSLTAGYTYAINDVLALNTLLAGAYRITRSADGTSVPASRERYQLQFGMTWMIAPGLYVEPAVGVRLGGSSPDLQFSLNLPSPL